MRAALAILLPLLLPLVAYLLWRWLKPNSVGPAWLNDVPWVPLLGGGAVLVVISLLVWEFNSGAAPGTNYIPPHMEDGKIVPGRFEK